MLYSLRSIALHCRRRITSFPRLLRSFHQGCPALEEDTSSLMDPSERYCYKPTLRWDPQVEEYFIKAYGADHFARISEALTRPSCYSCLRVNSLKTTSDAVIQKLKEMEYGIRKNGTNGMDTVISEPVDESNMELHNTDSSSKRGGSNDVIHKCPIPGLDYVVFVQGSGPHEFKYDHAPGQPLKEVIVSRKCAEAVLRGAQVFVPGVLACSAHVEKGDTVAVSVALERLGSDGKWGTGITRGTILQGLDTDPHYYQRKGFYIGRGTAMMSRAGIFRVLQGEAICMSDRLFDLPSLNNVLEGDIFLQNLPSIVAAHALDPQKGERILDMCAAPGGKTTAIAMLMGDEGEVVACDRSHNKVIDIQNLASELGLKSIVTYKLDALKSVNTNDADLSQSDHGVCAPISESCSIVKEEMNGTVLCQKDFLNVNGTVLCQKDFLNVNGTAVTSINKVNGKDNRNTLKNGPGKSHVIGGRVEKSKCFPPNSFDRVLLDAPCSALGLRPRLFSGEETLKSLRSDGKYQRKMFDQAVQLVRPGGILVYSTCTINPGENEALVRYALDKYNFLSLAPQHPRVGGPGLLGRCEMSDGYVEEWLRPGEEEVVQRFDPSVSDTIGFFIAKFSVGCKEPN